MSKLEKVIKGLTDLKLTAEVDNRTINGYPTAELCIDALSLLKAQELPPVKPEKLEEVTTKWLDEMTAEERLKKIAMILDDWDGYRTAKGLAGLINEVWAYALYPVKEQEARMLTLEEIDSIIYKSSKEDERIFWAETRSMTKCSFGIFQLDIEVGGDFEALLMGCSWPVCYRRETYGIKWRCWTSKPTKEQREEISWND